MFIGLPMNSVEGFFEVFLVVNPLFKIWVFKQILIFIKDFQRSFFHIIIEKFDLGFLSVIVIEDISQNSHWRNRIKNSEYFESRITHYTVPIVGEKHSTQAKETQLFHISKMINCWINHFIIPLWIGLFKSKKFFRKFRSQSFWNINQRRYFVNGI